MVSTAQLAPPPAPKGDRMFVALRLGPVTRAPMYQHPLASSILPAIQGSSPAEPPVKYPRIIVRDFLGRTLDTYTTLQEAIYRASWTRRKMGDWPRTPLEWRLPKAPAPAKPDYSRSGPLTYSSRHDNRYDVTAQSQDSRRVELTTNVLVNLPTVEIAVDDVSFVAESLNQLPNLPSFTFLRHSLLAGQATYVQIVASILLHQKQLRELDRREAVWSFPGFCTGCQRAGLCYGCSKSTKPHVHEDIPAMTGGGFRFWKRDRPRDPHLWKHPGNWKVPTSEEELKSIIEKYGDLASYQRAMMRAGQRMADTGDVTSADQSRDGLRYQRLKSLGTYPPRVAIVTTDDFLDEMLNDMDGQGTNVEDMDGQGIDVKDMDGRELDKEEGTSRRHRESRRRRVGVMDDRSGSGVTEDPSSDHAAFRVTVRSRGGEEEDELRDWIERRRKEEDEDEGIELEERRQRSRGSVPKWGPAKKGNSSPPAAPKRSRFEQKPSDEETEELTRLLRERAKENVPFGKKRRDVSYQAPKFFTVQKTSRHVTVARDPFSDKRDLDLPKGPAFQLKKSERKTTKFVEFKKGERGWKAPKMFEVKHEEKQPTKFWQGSSPSGDRRSRRKRGEGSDDDSSERRRRQKDSLDSGIASGSAGETDVIPPQPENIASEGQDDKDKNQDDDTNKAGEVIQREPVKVKVKRREVVKKTKVERPVTPPPQSPPRLSSPPPVRKRTPPPPTPSPPPSPTPQQEEPPLPELELPEVPDLPEIEDKLPEKRKQKMKFSVEAPPQPTPTDVPVKRRAAPKVRRIPKHLSRPRRSRPAEAPVLPEDLMDIQDPLDFLNKYCIINPDRLPFYEIVFEATVAEQKPRYQKPEVDVSDKPEVEVSDKPEVEVSDKQVVEDEGDQIEAEAVPVETNKGKGKKKTHVDQKTFNSNLLSAQKGMNIEKVAMTLEEQHLEKLIYTLDLLQDKMNQLTDQLDDLEAKRMKLLAEKAREKFPDIASPNYFPKLKKKGKKEKKGNQTEPKLRAEDITDEVILSRLEDRKINEMCQEPELKFLESEIDILKVKVKEIQNRVEQIAGEKLLADAFCMNHFFMRQGVANKQPEDYRRQQSELYNRLRPNPDFEMNLEEVEEALQQINNHLLTDKEFFFLYNVLNLPGRERINFRLFTIIAALSEKVTQLDPVIRKLINNFNYNALDIKMEKCKELFELLETEHMPKGAAQAASLAVELTAGGLKPEHTRYVLNKFNRENKGLIDFLDFVTYVPLFVEIHKRIINDPLSKEFDL